MLEQRTALRHRYHTCLSHPVAASEQQLSQRRRASPQGVRGNVLPFLAPGNVQLFQLCAVVCHRLDARAAHQAASGQVQSEYTHRYTSRPSASRREPADKSQAEVEAPGWLARAAAEGEKCVPSRDRLQTAGTESDLRLVLLVEAV